MKTNSLYNQLEFKDNKPAITVLLESDFTKEIRIAFKENQVMKEHKTPFPIVVELVDGKLDFGVNGEALHLKKGDLLALEGGVPHDLKALTESVVRLTLSKGDKADRVKQVSEQ